MIEVSKLRLSAALWLAGMAGVVVLTLTVIPQLLRGLHTPVPLSVAVTASLVQSGVLLALAAWLGATLSRPLGLRAPATEAALTGSSIWAALKPQLIPGVLMGLAAGAVLLIAMQAAPPELQSAGSAFHVPASAKLLYGGITEEILMRWGLMTLIAWLAWRFLQQRKGSPHPGYMGGAILMAALLFGLGHLPAVAAMGLNLTPSVIAYVLIGNIVPGVLFGFSYWRWGLESAFIAHATAHLTAIVAGAAI